MEIIRVRVWVRRGLGLRERGAGGPLRAGALDRVAAAAAGLEERGWRVVS